MQNDTYVPVCALIQGEVGRADLSVSSSQHEVSLPCVLVWIGCVKLVVFVHRVDGHLSTLTFLDK